MKRLIANTKFQSPDDLIYVGQVSDHETWGGLFGYDHQIDSYSDEFKGAVIEIVNKQKKERNKKGLPLKNYTNDADKVIKDFISPYNHSYFPEYVLKYSDIFDGKYYIDYTDLYRLTEMFGGVDNQVNNYKKLIKSSPYYISEDKDGQLNLIPNQVIFDLLNPDIDSAYSHATLDYVDHAIRYKDYINNVFFTFYPVDKKSAEIMLKEINKLAWNQDITDYLLSQEEILWRE